MSKTDTSAVPNRVFYFGDLAKGKQNNFDFLRFLAASMVIYFHAFPLTGASVSRDLMFKLTGGQISSGNMAVKVFFVMSGFLIAASYDRSQNLFKFVRARALRILPGLAAVVLVGAMIVGPLVTSLPLSEYFSSHATYAYLLNMTTKGPDRLPGVFMDNAYAGAVNGSLWTLFYEMICYCVVAFLGVTRMLKKPVVLCLLLIALLVPVLPVIPHQNFFTALKPLLAAFAAGMCAYMFRNEIPIKWYLVVGSVIALIIARISFQFQPAFSVFGAYLVLCLAFSQSIRLYNFAKRGDMSYGIYIYAFPIQQSVTHFFGGTMNAYLNMLISYPITILCAFMSWNFVEKRFLRLKK